MSWSVAEVGKAGAVAKKLAEDFARIKCEHPEETIKNMIASAIDAALSAFPPGEAVKVTASGSQWKTDKGDKINSLSVQIEPIYGFRE